MLSVGKPGKLLGEGEGVQPAVDLTSIHSRGSSNTLSRFMPTETEVEHRPWTNLKIKFYFTLLLSFLIPRRYFASPRLSYRKHVWRDKRISVLAAATIIVFEALSILEKQFDVTYSIDCRTEFLNGGRAIKTKHLRNKITVKYVIIQVVYNTLAVVKLFLHSFLSLS